MFSFYGDQNKSSMKSNALLARVTEFDQKKSRVWSRAFSELKTLLDTNASSLSLQVWSHFILGTGRGCFTHMWRVDVLSLASPTSQAGLRPNPGPSVCATGMTLISKTLMKSCQTNPWLTPVVLKNSQCWIFRKCTTNELLRVIILIFCVSVSPSSSGIPWARETVLYKEIMSPWNTAVLLCPSNPYPYPNLICISLLLYFLILHLFCFSLQSYPQQHRTDGCLFSDKHPGTTINCSIRSKWH